jgi:hypothetical protein
MKTQGNNYSVLVFGSTYSGTPEFGNVLRVDTNGIVGVGIYNTSGSSILSTPADSLSPTSNNNVPAIAFMEGYNGASFDRWRNNGEVTALASAARTAAINSADLTNYNWKGAHIIVNVSSYTSGTLTVTIQGKDPISGSYYSILVGAGITSAGITILKVYPGILAAPNAAASDIIPRTWRVSCSAVSATYSVAAVLDV